MKTSLLTVCFLCVSACTFGQHKQDSLSKSLQGNNEIKLNILYTILGSPEITYERMLDHHNALGAAVFFRAFGMKMDFNSGVYPHFRHYFGARKSSGLFLEGHGAILAYDGGHSGDKVSHYIDPFGNSIPVAVVDETYYGFGAALGGKFLTRKGFIGEIYLGASKLFAKAGNQYQPRMGLTLGKKF